MTNYKGTKAYVLHVLGLKWVSKLTYAWFTIHKGRAPGRGPALRGSVAGNRFEVVLVLASVGGGATPRWVLLVIKLGHFLADMMASDLVSTAGAWNNGRPLFSSAFYAGYVRSRGKDSQDCLFPGEISQNCSHLVKAQVNQAHWVELPMWRVAVVFVL